ncbi:MAG: nitroreductase family protein [Candidatus Zixiibacteriota bacterium]
MEKLLAFLMIWVSSLILCFSATMAENRPGLSLKETFDIYVRSVQNSDLHGLFSTVTDEERFFFVTANGKLIDTREGYRKFHEGWFKERDWEMPVELLEVQEGKDYGYTNAIFHYRARTPDGRTYNLDSYFTLVFHKEDGQWKVVADICAPIARYLTEENSEVRYDMDQEYLFRTIKERRTVRKYKSQPVPDEHVRRILDTARFAPTAGNVQPWRFVVIQDRARLDGLAEMLRTSWEEKIAANQTLDEEKKRSYTEGGKEAIADAMTAPVYIMVFVDTTAYAKYAVWDGCLAVENLMLAAKSLGYGTAFFTTYFPEEVVKSFLRAPDNLQFICATPVGIPEEWPEMPEKKSLDEMVFYESF